MNRRPEYSSLCSLIDKSVSPYTEQDIVSVSKEKEKELLISLSQVLRQIKQWTHALDDSDHEPVAKPYVSGECWVVLMSHSEHNCLTKIIGDLLFLLAIECQLVQHVVGNVLGAIAEFVAASGSNWYEFIRTLCLSLELAISNSLSSSMDLPTGATGLDCNSSRDATALKAKLKDANWYSVAAIVRILRNILKYLKQEFDDQLFETYLDSVNSCLSNIPWDRLNAIHVDQNGESLLYITVGEQKSPFIFWGNILQFFCSLVGQIGSPEAEAGRLNKLPSVREINNIFPKVLYRCFGEQRDSRKTCISHYFKHKILILMIRLSFQINPYRSTLVSWLHLINTYFQDLISEPITQLDPDQDDSLEGSPFLLSFCDAQKHRISSRHLQRLAVFLFLRCSFCLVNPKVNTEPCACENLDSCSVFDRNSGPTCCSRKEGLLEICKWLQMHLPADIFLDREMCFEKCMGFTLSFIKLYMHEDDILFKMLLQLFCVPFYSDQRVSKGKRTSQEVKDNVFSHLSNLFHPIRLFHLFLAELCYDHQVLLDYLISKDTGTSSAEYHLKCLRTIGDSWDLFKEFSFGGNALNQSSLKKRKIVVDSGDLKGDVPFKNAMDCLLSLKKSLENLHHKNLFPYNPQVLLRRLTRFEELCLK